MFSTYDEAAVIVPTGRLTATRRAPNRAGRADQGQLQRLLRGVEERQHRHALYLHDHVLQDLYGLRLEVARPRAAEAVVGDRIDTLADRVRTLTDHLLPPSLLAFGLTEALRAHVACWEPGLDVTLVLPVEPTAPSPVDLFLLRIVQEGLANVARHAGVSQARVEVAVRRGGLTLEVSDRGTGFAVPRSFQRFVADERFGLFRARAYARAAGGRLTVTSAPGAGTVLAVRVPTFVPTTT